MLHHSIQWISDICQLFMVQQLSIILIVLWIFWVSANITNLTPPLFIEVPVPSQENKRSCISVLEWVSEWLLFNANSVIFQLYQVNFQCDDDEVRFVLDQHLSWIFIVLAHWNNSLWIYMSPHSDTLSWFIFIANHSVLFLLNINAACLAEMQKIPILQLWFDSNQQSTALEESTLTLHNWCGFVC